MTNLSKFGKQISAIAIVFAILAVSLFTGSVFVNAAEPVCTAGGAILYWNGTEDSTLADNGETGTPDNPIIIDDASELNYLANRINGNTDEGKRCYKMADGISKVVLQPESVVNVDANANGVYDVFELSSGEATKTFFESTITPVHWISNSAEHWFAGTFDGNGVEFVGMYAVGCSTGLFPTADAGAVFKNLAVTNSYIAGVKTAPAHQGERNNGNCRTGAIVGGSCGFKYGAKVGGTVVFDSIIVANCSISTERGLNSAAVIMGSDNSEDAVNINNAIVYGNKTYATDAPTAAFYISNGAGNLYTANDSQQPNDAPSISNVIVLGATPITSHIKDDKYYKNIYTDANVDKIENYTNIKSVAGLTSIELLEACGGTIGAYHGTIALHKDERTHFIGCGECGFALFEGVADHTWADDTHKCTVCDFACTHSDKTVDNSFAGDCVTPAGAKEECNICHNIDSIPAAGATAPGHVLEWVPEIVATCKSTGRLGYWHCKTCNSNFAGTQDNVDAVKFAAMKDSVADPDNYAAFFTPIAKHKSTQIKIDGSKGHYWLCDTCGGRILSTESKKTVEDGRVKRHTWEDGACVDCKLECPKHNYQPSGKIISAGSCTEGRVEELKCTICGDTKTATTATSHEIVKVEEVAATDKLEGTKAHYICNKCKALFADAEGKVPTDVLALVIPKVLPEEYQNKPSTDGSTSTDAPQNADTSTTSPKTGDNIASVMAVALLAGAAFVATRKFK